MTRFCRTYDTLLERERQDKRLLPEVRALIAEARQGLPLEPGRAVLCQRLEEVQ